jgi:hypothetical protein
VRLFCNVIECVNFDVLRKISIIGAVYRDERASISICNFCFRSEMTRRVQISQIDYIDTLQRNKPEKSS